MPDFRSNPYSLGDPDEVDAIDYLEQLEAAHQDITRRRGAVVVMCRAEGYSWTEIGEVLGMSRQAAHQAYRAGCEAEADHLERVASDPLGRLLD